MVSRRFFPVRVALLRVRRTHALCIIAPADAAGRAASAACRLDFDRHQLLFLSRWRDGSYMHRVSRPIYRAASPLLVRIRYCLRAVSFLSVRRYSWRIHHHRIVTRISKAVVRSGAARHTDALTKR